jgi:hypothetical protein
MRLGLPSKQPNNERAVANLIEYIMISGVLMGLLIVMLLLVNTNIMEDPANRLVYVTFTDIGNGVSTRIVDVYAIGPSDGTICTHFDIPDDIAGKDYFVDVGSRQNPVNAEEIDQYIQISRGSLEARISLAGIGSSREAAGQTTGKGLNRISYNSEGKLNETAVC